MMRTYNSTAALLIFTPAALLPMGMQELDYFQVPVLSGVVHGIVGAAPHVRLVQPRHHMQVTVEGRVVHGSDAATLLPVAVQPFHDVEVPVACRLVHRRPGAALSCWW